MTFFPDNDLAREETAVRAVELAYDDAWSAGDVETLLSLFTPDAVIINPYGETWRGIEQIAPALRAFLSSEGTVSTHFSRVNAVYLVSPTVALVDAVATLRGPGLPGGELVHSFTDVLLKQRGEWRICHVRAYSFMRRPA